MNTCRKEVCVQDAFAGWYASLMRGEVMRNSHAYHGLELWKFFLIYIMLPLCCRNFGRFCKIEKFCCDVVRKRVNVYRIGMSKGE